MRLVVVIVAGLVIGGCNKHLNPDFCAAHADECSDAGSGSNAMPRSDADCDSLALLPDGTCAVESDVIYASADGAGTDCSKASPCALATAFGQLATKRLLHVSAGRYAAAAAIQLPNAGRHYQLFGPATFEQGLAATTGVDVELDFLEITGAPATGLECANAKVIGVALSIHGNGGYGVQAAPCSLTLSRSTIAHDQGGALFVNQGVIDIANNLFVQNGDPNDSAAIAVQIQAATGRLSFNTIAYNRQGNGATHPAGVHCAAATALTATGNLITANDRGGAYGTQADGAGCDFSTSYTMPGSPNNDLGFNAIDGSPVSFRLTALSRTVIDVPGLTCAGTDIDGDPRPLGGGCDDGADEFNPQ